MSTLPALPLSPAYPVRRLGMVCCAYLVVFAGAVLAWLAFTGIPLNLEALGACALVPLAGLALLWRDIGDARRYTLHMLAATLACPIVLLFWAGSIDPHAEPPRPERPVLDAQRLVRGAADVQDAPLQGAGIVFVRSARFNDHTELRLTRFDDTEAAERYLSMLTQGIPSEPFFEAGRRGRRLVGVGSTFVLLELHGPDLLDLRARDMASGLARLAAQQVPAPADRYTRAPAEPAPRWPFFAVMALLHGAVFVALIAWGSVHTTRVPAQRGAPVATPEQLQARLLSLGRPGGPFEISEVAVADGAPALRVDASPDPHRTHQITLRLDPTRGCVHVHEKLRVNGDAPRDEDEATMASVGESSDWHSAAGPDAQYVWTATWQATMIEPRRLNAVPLMLHAHHAELPRRHAATLDGEGVLTVLCALVTRSGWHWQPKLWGSPA
ncbi:hypothetical protein [Piscinibacter sp. HJYY11]|uniref:hypothetical protein n=1 Tax=Piscinibacter sp. HJYY11 TaxID=2801333 RepID=UPI00191F2770|nr:hypothetical protein [Piscinibacter sp. HJYY11]MBL0730048.1 hypothetical protein [Piscinibacter sp. HJYY11]